MGLPSDNRWAVSNLDANGPYYFQETPFQYECSFFSWGNVTPHNPVSENGFDYNFGGANSAEPWYEGQPYGDTPGSQLTGNIPLANDAARKLLGSVWHMPNSADFQELIDNVRFINADGTEIESTKTNKLVSVNGCIGLYMESKINGARLFIPCSGYGTQQSWSLKEVYGFYWSTNVLSMKAAGYLRFFSGGIYRNYSGNRCNGYSIRPIWNPRDLRG